MTVQDFIELTAYWGNDDADSTIKVSRKKWEQIKAGAQFQKSAKSYYEGRSYDVVWQFSSGKVLISGDDGMMCADGLPVEDLILRQAKSGDPP